MSNPNSAVWGAPETWQFAKWLYNVGGYNPTDKKAGRPKCANFSDGGDTSASLNAGNTAGKTPINTPLDKTICPCGQDPAVSVFGKIAMFKNKQNAQQNIIPDKVIERIDPVNWTFYTNNTGANPKQLRDRTNTTQRWSPNATALNNDNGNINPFVYYQSRSLFAKIYVRAWSGWNTQYPDSPTGGRNMTLAEWKNNYSSYFITDVWLELCGITGISGDTYSYGAGQSSGHGFGVAQLDDIDGIYDYADSSYPIDQFIYLFRQLSGNYYNTASTFYLPAYGEFENEVVKSRVYYSWELTRAIPYTANNYEKIMKMVACFGIPFSDKNISQFTYTSADLYLPIIDDNGITHGEYTHGSDNATNPFYNLESVRDKNYEPGKPIDPNTYSDTTAFNTVNFINAFTKRYILTSAQVGQLAGELWNANAQIPADTSMTDYALDEYLTNNPIDTIVSLKYFPCTFADVAPAIVHLGKYQTNIAATALGTSVRVIDYDPINVFRHFNDYRDFEPYTEITLYIPFCGTVKIPTAECMGKYVAVKLVIDTATGAATGFVIVSESGSGGICVATATGTAAIDIPVSGLQSVNIQQAIFNAAATYTQTQISNLSSRSTLLSNMGGIVGTFGKGLQGSLGVSELKSGVLGGPIGALGSMATSLDPIKAYQKGVSTEIESAKAEYNLQHIEMPMRLIGSASPILSTVLELQCRMIIYRPITDENALASYADTVGFACLKSGTVSDFSGLTVGTIDVSGINATEQEKSAIAAAFANGVYL